MPRNRPRKTEQGFLVEVADDQIPGWVREVPHPGSPPLSVVLTRARYEAAWFEEPSWGPWFRALAQRTHEMLGAGPYAGDRLRRLLALLDLVPAYLDVDELDWVRDGVRWMFLYRQYDELDAVRQALGKQPTDQNLVVYRLYEYARLRGYSSKKAIAYAREAFSEISEVGIKKAIGRASKSAALFAGPSADVVVAFGPGELVGVLRHVVRDIVEGDRPLGIPLIDFGWKVTATHHVIVQRGESLAAIPSARVPVPGTVPAALVDALSRRTTAVDGLLLIRGPEDSRGPRTRAPLVRADSSSSDLARSKARDEVDASKRAGQRSTPQGRAVEVLDRQIPDWVRAVTPPSEPPLAAALTQMRSQPGAFEACAWGSWFRRIATAAEKRIGEPPYRDERLVDFIRLLDLVPGYLHFPKEYAWILRGVRDVFTYRRYDEVRRARSQLGKLASDRNMAVNFYYQSALSSGMSHSEAMRWLQMAYPQLTHRALRLAIERAAKSGFAPSPSSLLGSDLDLEGGSSIASR